MFTTKNIEQKKKHFHPDEREFILKLLYYIYKTKGKRISDCVKHIRYKTGGKFSRWYFYNVLRGSLVFSKFSTILHVLDYLECNYSDIECLNVPDNFRRKYIK